MKPTGLLHACALTADGRDVGRQLLFDNEDHARSWADNQDEGDADVQPPLGFHGPWRVDVRWPSSAIPETTVGGVGHRAAEPVEIPGLEREPTLFGA